MFQSKQVRNKMQRYFSRLISRTGKAQNDDFDSLLLSVNSHQRLAYEVFCKNQKFCELTEPLAGSGQNDQEDLNFLCKGEGPVFVSR